MSIDEVLKIAATFSTWLSSLLSPVAAIEQHVAKAVAREREECALICDAEGREWGSDAVVTLKNYAEHCAAAIRARAEKETT